MTESAFAVAEVEMPIPFTVMPGVASAVEIGALSAACRGKRYLSRSSGHRHRRVASMPGAWNP